MGEWDAVVVGAGVIGLAVARALALSGREVLVLEAHSSPGTATSSRNSEVMHAGLYYPSGSLKAELCVRGRALLEHFCSTYSVPHRRIGKLLVAIAPAQHSHLEALARQGRANGVNDLRELSAREAQALEPALHCTAALLSPSTGILDSHAYLQALWGQAEGAGATVVLRSPVQALRVEPGVEGMEVAVGGAQPSTVRAQVVVNAAGPWAPALAARTEGLPEASQAQAYFCKGSYFSCTGRSPFHHLIYPMPDEAGLGTHLTLDLAGQMRFGPDTEWIDVEVDVDRGGADLDAWYPVEAWRRLAMVDAIRRYWPGLPDGALQPAYAGIRPKVVGPGAPAADFRIDGPAQHGVPGLVNLLGIESPGLTASLAIAEHVLAQLR